MSELDDVLAALDASTGDDVALATVVAVRGSTYRREGARLVIPAEGETVGNISGGCLEGDVIQTAREVLASGRPQLLQFDLTADDEAVWGWGLGCNGAIDVLVEPAAMARPFVAAMRSARRDDRAVALVTLVDGPGIGDRLIVHPDGSTEGDLGPSGPTARDAALDALAAGRSATVNFPTGFAEGRSTTLSDPGSANGGTRAFVEVLEPALRLVICGAGHDAMPVVEFGARLGWRVEVVDDRRAFLTAERFPQAARLVHAQPTGAAAAVAADDRAHEVVMSHNFLRDAAYLGSFLDGRLAYLGMLGPATRLDRLLDALVAEGHPPPAPDAVARIHGPAGLDIGAEGPEEIAWAIVAEILAVQRGAGAGFLKGRGGPIHLRAGMERVG